MIILGTNSIKDTGYDVANSLRFNDDSQDFLNRTLGTPTNNKKWTYSAWLKKSSQTDMIMFSCGANNNDRGLIYFNNSGDLNIYGATSGSGTYYLATNRLFRDNSAWSNIVISYDSTQSTSTNRIKIYVNGVQETSLSQTTYPAEDHNSYFNSAIRHDISGRMPISSDYLYNGYMAEVCFIDGQQLTPTSFGEFDEDSGIFKPINVSGLTFGNNGFYLDFEDSGALGNDAAGSNNFTVNNLTAIDQSTDTCTNNFCTMNPLYPDGTITFSEGNLKLTEGNSWRSAGGTMAVSQGKWFWEVSNVGNYAYIGFADIQLFSDGCSIRESFTTAAATTGRAHSVLNSDGRHYQVTSGGAQSSEYPAAATFSTFTNSIIGVALNLDDNNFILYKDGTAMNSGTAISITAGTYIPAVSIYGNNVSYNFGSPPYSESGGNSDGNGYGNFSMAVPSGYYSLNTKNLAEYG